jgi:hypothetical protein
LIFLIFLKFFGTVTFRFFGFWEIVAINTIVWCYFETILTVEEFYSRNLACWILMYKDIDPRFWGIFWVVPELGLFWLFFGFFKDAKLGTKLLCLSKRPPKYQKVEINMYSTLD